MSTTIVDLAVNLAHAQISVVPVAADGTKRPAIAWKQYTRERADQQQIHAWFDTNPDLGVGVITGAVSGNLEMLEVEGRAMDQIGYLRDLAEGSGIGPLLTRIEQGWLEQSPSSGLHWFYRVQGDIPGNTKLAQGPDHVTLAETRGEGGFVVVAPSGGTVHPSGKPYVRLLGGPDTVATITLDEREALHTVFTAALDQTPDPELAEPATGPLASLWTDQQPGADGDVKPGDDYEAKTDWADILGPHGWTLIHTTGQTRYWRRPGKDIGISATTGHAQDRDRLYVFTTSTEFQAGKPYTKFGAYALLEHGGDYAAAASALHAAGYGRRAPRTVEVKSGETANNITAKVTSTDAAPTTFTISDDVADQTDSGNAARLVQAYGPDGDADLTYIPTSAQWAAWTGTRWEIQDDQAAAIRRADTIARNLPETLDDTSREVIGDPKKIEKAEGRLRAFKAASLSHTHLVAAIQLAATDPQIRTPLNAFDQQPLQLNTPQGTVDLATGHLHQPDPAEHHSKQTGAQLQQQPTPLWDNFLEQTFDHDQQMIRYVQQLAGLSAIGEVREHVLPFLHGEGANGKSVFLEVLQAALGDYAATAPKSLVLAGRRDQPDNEIAELTGRRLVTISEIPEEARFDEELLKRLTGGDRLKARKLYQNFYEFTPTHTLWLAGNSQPKVAVGGTSFWRRLRLIPFTHTVPEDQRDERLAAKIETQELPGVLTWIVAGAVDYLQHGLTTPLQVRVATDAYQADEDHLQQFVAERLQPNPADRAETKTVYTTYRTWCQSNGFDPIDARSFGRQLKTKIDCTKRRSNNRNYYAGITLLNDETTPVQNHWTDI